MNDCSDGYDESFCPSKCTFEDNNKCEWYNGYGVDLNMLWKLKRADSTTFGSGPNKDHTLGTNKGIKFNPFCIEKPL